MRKIVINPENGADIVNYKVGESSGDTSAREYTILKGDFLEVSVPVANYLKGVFGFLTISNAAPEVEKAPVVEEEAPVGEEDTVEEEITQDTPLLDDMNLTELRKIAKEKGVKIPFGSKKVEVVTLLSNK